MYSYLGRFGHPCRSSKSLTTEGGWLCSLAVPAERAAETERSDSLWVIELEKLLLKRRSGLSLHLGAVTLVLPLCQQTERQPEAAEN